MTKKPNATAIAVGVPLVVGAAILLGSVGMPESRGDGKPIVWQQQDVGAVGVPGASGEQIGMYQIHGSGADIWGMADAFHFVFLRWQRDGQFVVRVTSLEPTHPWAKAGIMIRSDLSPGSPYGMVAMSPGKGVTFLRRTQPGGASQDDALQATRVLKRGGGLTFQQRSASIYQGFSDSAASVAFPRWLKLVRQGQTVAAYDSGDGKNWEWVGTDSISISDAFYVGMAVTSHDNSRLASAQFDQVDLRSDSNQMIAKGISGHGDGLLGTYYPRMDLSGDPVKRVDAAIDFDWAGSPAQGIGNENFSVRWEGDLQAQFTELYALHVISDDRARLWLNGRLLIDEWEEHPEAQSTAMVPLEAGRNYFLRLEFFQDRGKAVARLLWSSPSTPKQVVPQSQLFSQPEDRDGDGIPDSWEIANGLNPNGPHDPDAIAGEDGQTHRQEFEQGELPWAVTKQTEGLPSGWKGMDVGTTGQPGDGRLEGPTVVVRGSGADVWGRADGFQFVYTSFEGDGQMVARVGSLDNTDPWAKAGLMMRKELSDGSVNAFVALTAAHGATFQCRTEENGGTVANFGGPVGDLCWLKLIRYGNVFSAYQSDDGINWTWIGTESLPMPDRVQVGLAVTSHDNSRLASARFDGVSFGPTSPLIAPPTGSGDGLLGTYRDGTTGTTVIRVDPTVDFDWRSGSPAQGIGAQNFSVQWEGAIEAQFSEPYHLHILSDDGARLWVDGQKVIDDWTDHAVRQANAGLVLQAGERHLVRLEYYQKGGEDVAQLLWSSPSTPRQPIPQSQLYSTRNPSYSAIASEVASAEQGPTDPNDTGSIIAASPAKIEGGKEGADALLAPNLAGVTTVSERAGAELVGKLGRWATAGRSVYAQDGRGFVEYMLEAPKADMYRLEVEAGTHGTTKAGREYPLLVSIDGEYLGRSILISPGVAVRSTTSVRQLTPWLKAGPHLAHIYWDNAAKFCPPLEVAAVRLQSLDGPDTNGDGVKDWVENRLKATCGVEMAPATSMVSPACIEGRGGYLSMMGISGGVVPQHGAGDRWYANVPLSPTGPASVKASFQNGGLVETKRILWARTDLLRAQNLTIRTGDSLMLGIGPGTGRLTSSGAPSEALPRSTITVSGTPAAVVEAGQSIVHRFDRAGVYKVTGSYIGPDGLPQSRSITVSVVSLNFRDPPVAWMGKSRRWDIPALPRGLVLENDPRLEILSLSAGTRTASGLGLKIDAQESRFALERIGLGGPVAASVSVEGFRLFAASDTYVQVIRKEQDGSLLVESGLVLSPLLPNVRVHLEIVVVGVIFDDSTVSKDLTAKDFNELGQARVRFIKPADVQTSVCHTTKAYQNGILLGSN